ncbi:MAG TPA: PHP domain-containing protein [Acetivibrio sp.]|uniref:PHP domain-containing protein n=1 Tax=Acetivibrio sp. TaxID=1872092 RepID=UPI002B879BA9|nr:PHP domain-containing protein [Acetivibrio sp.]HOM02771.1 PHP domain-containing protein [Acetivibrio sp.]
MDRFIDMHTHSVASDGSMRPSELVRHAKESGLSAVALTDHDTVDGIKEALEEGERLGFEVVPGVEISLDFDTEMHMLGYFFGESYLNIEPVLKRLRENREKRNPKIVENLSRMGFDITIDEVIAEAQGRVVARPHIASVMVKKGYVKSVAEAFEKYLANGKPAYVKRETFTPEEGIKAIRDAGGIPVLAHPIYLGLSIEGLDGLLTRLVTAGLKGIEAYYVDNTADDTGNLLRLAIKHNIVPTGGSDFHGRFKPDISIGKGRGNLRVPYEVLERLKSVASVV